MKPVMAKASLVPAQVPVWSARFTIKVPRNRSRRHREPFIIVEKKFCSLAAAARRLMGVLKSGTAWRKGGSRASNGKVSSQQE